MTKRSETRRREKGEEVIKRYANVKEFPRGEGKKEERNAKRPGLPKRRRRRRGTFSRLSGGPWDSDKWQLFFGGGLQQKF